MEENNKLELSAYLKIKKEMAKRKIEELKDKGLIKKGLKLKKEDDFILIPVKEGYGQNLKKKRFEKMEKARDLIEELKEKGISIKKHSYDIVGDIAIVEIDEDDKEHEEEIGKAIAKVSRVRSVYAKESAMQGEYRIRKLRIIYGEDNPLTTYKENGCVMKFNIKEVFFSPRLSYERKRIADLVNNGEKILVMFAGVGPFALALGKKCKQCNVVGIELNKNAVEYFKENVKMNKLKNVEVLEGDVKKVVYEKEMEKKFDRILMPLPKDAEYFLKEAEYCAKKNATIHFYTFVPINNAYNEGLKKAKKYIKKRFNIEFWRKVRDYSKNTIQIVMDLKIIE